MHILYTTPLLLPLRKRRLSMAKAHPRDDYLYSTFRILLGLFFFMYGLKNFFGIWGTIPVTFSLGWFAGAGQLLIGLGLVTGVLVRPASFFGIIEMLVAFYVHTKTGNWNPITNNGGAALTFVIAFIATLAYGAKTWSLEKKVFGKEKF